MVAAALAFDALAQAEGDEKNQDPPELLHFTEKDLPSLEKDPAGPSEIEDLASRSGFNYARDTRRAARGDTKALKKFFMLAHDADGAAAEIIEGVPTVVYHLLGDARFAEFLSAQPLAYRMMVRNETLGGGVTTSAYLSRYFPRTTKLLFRREMVDWVSPNGLYAIRKVFSDEMKLAGSKVERAELIEKKSGKVLCDLTADDIGTGPDREGEALWSRDSKRVACLSADLTPQEGDMFSTPPPAPLRKQTAVYQLTDDSFARVDLALDRPPGRENDSELTGAVPGHVYTEPLRWEKANVLILQRHEYTGKSCPQRWITSPSIQSTTSSGRIGLPPRSLPMEQRTPSGSAANIGEPQPPHAVSNKRAEAATD